MKGVRNILAVAVSAIVPMVALGQPDEPEQGDVAAASWTHMERAQYLYDQGIVFEAIRELEAHVQRFPEDVAAHFMLGQLQEEVGHSERAAWSLTRVLQLDAGHRAAQRLLVRIRNNLGRTLDRTDPEAVLRYARICARPGSYDRAAAHYRLALSLEDSTAVQLEFAKMLYWAGAYEESAQRYDLVLGRNPASLPIQREAARVYLALGDFERAIAVLENNIRLAPEHIPAQLELVRALIWAGRLEEAEALLATVLQREPSGVEAQMVRGLLAEAQHELLRAHALYAAVLEREPEHLEAKARMAAMREGDRLKMARLRQQAEKAPDDAEVYLVLAALYDQHDQLGAAIDLLTEANRRLPEQEEIFRALRRLREKDLQQVRTRIAGFQASRERQHAQERETAEAWLEQNPDDRQMRLKLARLLVTSGQYAAAQEHLRYLLSAGPMDPLVVELLQLTRERLEQEKSLPQTASRAKEEP